jgi:hypothetical protein
VVGASRKAATGNLYDLPRLIRMKWLLAILLFTQEAKL